MTGQRFPKLIEPFPITSVCRADLVQALHISEEEALAIDECDMRKIADKLANAYCETGFWIDLPIVAEYVLGTEVNKREA